MAILGFARAEWETFHETGRAPRSVGWGRLSRIVLRKLDMIRYAHDLNDLRSPPGNRLEELKGDRAGWHSIRINDQWRIVFRWTDRGADDVDIVDYHD